MDAQQFQEVSQNYKSLIEALTTLQLPQLKLYLSQLAQKIKNKHNDFYSQYNNLKQMLQNTKEAKGKLALHYACAKGNVDTVAYLIEEIHIDHYLKDKQGNNAFFTAVQHGHYGLLRYLVQQLKVNLNNTKQGNINALHIAANHNYVNIMKYLIQNGIDIEKVSIYGKPINWSVGSGNAEATQLLLENGANPDGDCTCPCPTPLILAIDYTNHHLYQMLVSKGADVHCKDPQGYSTLHLASQKGNLSMVKDLVSKGVSVSYVMRGKTAFQLAFEKQKWDVVAFLRERTPQYESIQTKIQNQQSSPKQQPNPQKAEQIKVQGNVLYKDNKFQQALQQYQKALNYDPNNAIIHRNIAACYLALKKYQEALEHCQSAKNNEKKNIKTIYREAQAYIGLANLPQASASLWQCSMLDPESAFFRNQFKKYFDLAKKQYQAKQ